MALDKMTGGMAGINPIKPADTSKKGPQGPGAIQDGLDFKRALEQATGNRPAAGKPMAGMPGLPQMGLPSTSGLEKLKFSNHAIERMHSRGISFSPDQMKSIENAIVKAAQKGAKDTLVLTGESALIVSVKNNTVVTVMDRQAMKDNVFTNIDSTVVV